MPGRFINIFSGFLVFSFLFRISFPVEALQAGRKFIPPKDKVLLIVGQDKTTIQNYIKEIGVVPGGFSVYTSIQKMDGIYKPADYGGGIQHAQYLVSRYPNTVMHVGLYMVDGLNATLAGAYDKNIIKLAKWMKKTDRPFYLRIGYEFDSPKNNYDPQKYVQAYRYIVDKLRELEVENAAFVWHSYASLSSAPLSAWYPGDDYVDWIGISYFSPYNDGGMKKVARFARSKNKPLMIAEATPVKFNTSEGEETWKRWFEFVFKFIEENDVKIFCYINCHWDNLRLFKNDQWGDARLEANYYIKQNWLKKIRDDKFLNASFYLFHKLNQLSI